MSVYARTTNRLEVIWFALERLEMPGRLVVQGASKARGDGLSVYQRKVPHICFDESKEESIHNIRAAFIFSKDETRVNGLSVSFGKKMGREPNLHDRPSWLLSPP